MSYLLFYYNFSNSNFNSEFNKQIYPEIFLEAQKWETIKLLTHSFIYLCIYLFYLYFFQKSASKKYTTRARSRENSYLNEFYSDKSLI